MSIKRWSSLFCVLALVFALAPASATAKKPDVTGKAHACLVLGAKGITNPGLLRAAAVVCGEPDEPGIDCDDPTTWPGGEPPEECIEF